MKNTRIQINNCFCLMPSERKFVLKNFIKTNDSINDEIFGKNKFLYNI